MELVLVGAQLQQILAGLVAVCLEQVLDPVRCVLKADLLFLQGNNSLWSSDSCFVCPLCNCKGAATYVEGNLFGLPPGEAEHGRAVSVEDLEDEHPLAEDSQHDASLGPLLREHSVEVDTVFCQLLANLQAHMSDTKENKHQVKVIIKNSHGPKQLRKPCFMCSMKYYEVM